jgi:hypothetical protein
MTFLLLTSVAYADISSDMKKTARTLSSLLRLSSQPKEFEKNSKEVTELFEQLKQSLAGNQKHFKGRSPHFEMNQKILQRLNLQAFRAYKLKRYEVSRQHLLAQPNVCLSCHQNDKIKSSAFSSEIPANLSPLEKAHLAVATRQPELALSLLDQAAKTNLKIEEREDALRTKLQILIAEKKLFEVKTELQKLLTTHSKDPQVSAMISGWIKGVDKAQQSLSQSLTSIEQAKRAVKKTFGTEEPTFGLLASPEDEVFFLVLKKNLLSLMAELKNQELPEAYYWMALCERAVGYDLYFSLADSFLVTCIENWPKLAVAKKCFKEYESFTEFAYSGSSGTHIPEDVKVELEELRRKISP